MHAMNTQILNAHALTLTNMYTFVTRSLGSIEHHHSWSTPAPCHSQQLFSFFPHKKANKQNKNKTKLACCRTSYKQNHATYIPLFSVVLMFFVLMLPVSVVYSFLLLNSIPLYDYTTVCESILLLIVAVSSLGLLCPKLSILM